MLEELKSSSSGGKKYSRRPDVDDEFQRMMRLHQSQWIEEAPNLKNETIICLLHVVRRADEQLFYALFQQLCRRLARIASRGASVYGIDAKTTQEIIEEVELQVLELVLTETPTRRTEVLEFAFGQAVKRRALDRSRKHKNSMHAHLDYIEVPSDYDDSGADPEATAINKVLLDQAWAVIEDPRIYQALFLHYYEGWSVEALMELFGAKRRHVKYMLEQGLQQMRDATGEGK